METQTGFQRGWRTETRLEMPTVIKMDSPMDLRMGIRSEMQTVIKMDSPTVVDSF
jgi:hypothetical protein